MSLLIFCVWGVDFPDRMFPYCLIQSSDLWDGLRYNRAPLGGPVDSTGCVQSELLNLFANNLKKTGILTEQKWNHFIHKSKNKDQIVSLINRRTSVSLDSFPVHINILYFKWCDAIIIVSNLTLLSALLLCDRLVINSTHCAVSVFHLMSFP